MDNTIGHNNPPEGDDITLRLEEAHADLTARRDELVAGEARVPEHIENEDIAGKAADFVVQIQKCVKNSDALRVKEKEPFLEGGRRVDGFFKSVSEPLNAAKRKVEARLTVYQKEKAAEERRIREAEEARARKEAERLEKEAREAAEKLEREEELAKAVAAERAAQEARAKASRAERIAAAPAADVSRTRSSEGSVSSLRTTWEFRNMERARLDLEALRQHLPEKALEQAVRSFIKAGGRELDGVEIYEDHQTVVR